jgi:RNA polymerase sigma-70 factor (ECF subfamily)
MLDNDAICDLIRRVREGDEQAATELVRHYEPAIRVVVRRRLTDPNLRRVLDSIDICQSILGRFFNGVVAGRFELTNEEQLFNLLATMARNKVTSHARKQTAARRDARRNQKGNQDPQTLADPGQSPSQVVANRELLEQIYNRLSAEERRLVDLQNLGKSWKEIAAAVGGSPDALRMQYTRAVARVARELGLRDSGGAVSD